MRDARKSTGQGPGACIVLCINLKRAGTKAAGRVFDGLLIQIRAGAPWDGRQLATEHGYLNRGEFTLVALCSGPSTHAW